MRVKFQIYALPCRLSMADSTQDMQEVQNMYITDCGGSHDKRVNNLREMREEDVRAEGLYLLVI